MTSICFVDTETTGLDPTRHEPWEIAVIYREGLRPGHDVEHLFRLKPDLAKADATGLRIGRYYERTKDLQTPLTRKPGGKWSDPVKATTELAHLFDGAHLVGAVPSFDAAFLERLLRKYGQAPTWHYHLVDVEALVAGYLAGTVANHNIAVAEGGYRDTTRPISQDTNAELPWRSDDLAEAIGVHVKKDDRHTAMGDARWVRDQFDRVFAAGAL